MTSFLRVISAIRQPDIAIYRTGRLIAGAYQRVYGSKAERQRDQDLPRRLQVEKVSLFRQSPARFFVDDTSSSFHAKSDLLVSQAEDILAHKFDLLGSGPIDLGPKIDWCRDPLTGFRWPDEFIGDLRTENDQGADIKWVWELSRFQFLPLLAIAQRVTSEGKYQSGAQELIGDWIRTNPVYVGPNWRCPMDVAIRACNWLYWWQVQPERESVDEDFVRLLLGSLLTHGRFIFSNLERHPAITNNHYLANLAGLAYLGLLLPPDTETRDWAVFARKELEKQVWKQLRRDGVNFEASIPYHRLALELLVCPALLYRLNGADLSYEFWKQIERGMEFVAAYTPPHGLAPQIGDNDNGRLHTISRPFGWPVNDHRYLLDIAAAFYPENPTFSGSFGTTDEARWIIPRGSIAEQRPAQPDSIVSRAFVESGVYILRTPSLDCLVDCGPVGQNGIGGHAHNDTLSFTLSLDNCRIIVDPGTATYSRSTKTRNLFRSTAMHNTVRIAGIEINDIPKNDCFRLASQDRPKVLSWATDTASDRLSACHYGYAKLSPSIVHLRTVALCKATDRLTVTDRFLGNGTHTAEWHIPLDPRVKARIVDSRHAVIEHDGLEVVLALDWEPDQFDILSTQYSESYGCLEANTTLHIRMAETSDRVYAWEIGRLKR